MKKKILFIFLLILFFWPFVSLGQENKTDTFFEAEVIEVLKEEKKTDKEKNETFVQQNLRLRGLEGEMENEQFVFRGIDDFRVLKNSVYEVGDEVVVVKSLDSQGNSTYYVTDYVRKTGIYWLFGLFVLVLLVVGKTKGFRALLSLGLSFFIIIKFILPYILEGYNPVLITVAGSLLILLIMIYLTEGFNLKSHIASLSILIGLLLTVGISHFFVEILNLTGISGEQTSFLLDINMGQVDFKGLLLAGIIIGALGVLDDVVISQVSTVEEIVKANPKLKVKEVFKRGYNVGVSHISSMTNTLFLAYTGASIYLLILFLSGNSAFNNFSQMLNNEAIAAEITRTLAGSIGLILVVPVSTYLASYFIKKRV